MPPGADWGLIINNYEKYQFDGKYILSDDNRQKRILLQVKCTDNTVGLTAAQGKETFYERFGFSKSNEMNMYIEK